MNKNLKLVLVAAVAASFVASAHTPDNVLVNNSGVAVKNNFGQCVEVINGADGSACSGEVVTPQKEIVPVAGTNFTLDAATLFAFNKANLTSAGKAELNAFIGKLSDASKTGLKKVTAIKVVGHTDSKGSVAYNQKLSERRAATVRNYLVKSGVPANMISAFGEGEMNPVASNATAEGRQLNRRVNISVSGVK